MKTLTKHIAKLGAGLGLALAAGAAAPAIAGGYNPPVVEAPVAAPAPVVTSRADGDWTGFHLGGQLSYGSTKLGAGDDDGAFYGVRAGYDYDFGNWVVGGLLDWNKADADLGGGTSLDSITRLGLRAGYDMGRTLVYGSLGAAHAEVDTAAGGASDDGYFGGVGVDYAVNDRWTIGGEIMTNRFEDFDGGPSTLSTTTAGINVGFRF